MCGHTTHTQTYPAHIQAHKHTLNTPRHTHMHTTHTYRYTNTYHTLYTCLFHTHRHYVYHMHAQTPPSHRDTPHTLHTPMQEASAYRAAKMLPHDSLRSGLCRGTKTILLVIAFCPQVNLWPEQIRGHCHSTEIAIMTS